MEYFSYYAGDRIYGESKQTCKKLFQGKRESIWRQKNNNDIRAEMDGPSGLDEIINQMNLNPNDIPDLDNLSLISGDTDRRCNNSGGITLNL